MPILLAHSGGYWDEFIFLGMALSFTIFMAIGWWRSRGYESEKEDKADQSTDNTLR